MSPRKDFEYINEATAMGLAATAKGREYSAARSIEELESGDGFIELLCLAEECYITVSHKADIDGWLEAVRKTAASEYDKDPGVTKEHIAKAFAEGYIAFRKIIWG